MEGYAHIITLLGNYARNSDTEKLVLGSRYYQTKTSIFVHPILLQLIDVLSHSGHRVTLALAKLYGVFN